MSWPERLLAWAVRYMPTDRQDWGRAMLAEMAQLHDPAERRQFALSCARVALFPPHEGGPRVMLRGACITLLPVALIACMLAWPETGGMWLAWAITLHTQCLIITKFLFSDLLLLGAVTWGVAGHVRGRQHWAKVPPVVRHWGRLAVEIYFGLLNPVLYLAILTSWLPLWRLHSEWPQTDWWLGPLQTLAVVLLAAVWGWRLFGAAFRPDSPAARAGLRILLGTALATLLIFAIKDLNMLTFHAPREGWWVQVLFLGVIMSPLYLIPAVLLFDHLRAAANAKPGHAQSFFLLPDRSSRIAVACAAGVAVVTFALAAQRRPDADVRALLSEHRQAIREAGQRYGVDPRTIAAIAYVTHRDQLSPLRDSIERVFSIAWTIGLPDKALEKALDLSIGFTQIKPRTAVTAAMLASGRSAPDKALGFFDYEPLGTGWPEAVTLHTAMPSPIPVPGQRDEIVRLLLKPETNLETCAMILSLYQRQWEATNPAWSIRQRPDILATLYQIGFSRSKPHGSPRSNAFGTRVREVYDQAWLGELIAVR